MTTPHHDDEITGGLDRRNFLKKAGITGAAGIATPLLVQSVLNPAAACSGPTLSAASLGAFPLTNNADAAAFNVTVPVLPAGSNATRLLVIAFNYLSTSATSTLIVSVDPPGAPPVFNATARVDLVTPPSGNPYVGPIATLRYNLCLFTAPVTTTGIHAINVGTTDRFNFVAQVGLITSADSTQPPAAGSAVFAKGSGGTASVTGTGAADGAMYAVFGSAANGGAWSTPTPTVTGPPANPNGWAELADTLSNQGAGDVSMMSAFSKGGSNQTASSTTTAGLGWAAIALSLNC